MDNGKICLPVSSFPAKLSLEPEILFIDGRRRVPSQTFYQYNDGWTKPLRVFIFQAATDALAYFQLKKLYETDSVFLVVGKNPSNEILDYIKSRFSYARFALGFPNNLLARLSAIKLAGRLSDEKIGLSLTDGKLLCSYRNKNVAVSIDRVSMSEVSKLTGFWPKIRMLKPPKGYECYYDFIRCDVR